MPVKVNNQMNLPEVNDNDNVIDHPFSISMIISNIVDNYKNPLMYKIFTCIALSFFNSVNAALASN